MKPAIASLAVLSVLLSGCASITTGHGQPLSVETRDQSGKPVTGAACRLVNDKGTYFINTPGTVGVKRSYEDMHVHCTKEPLEPGAATVKSSTKGMAFGNILFGGIIGAAIDVGSGAAYDYPALLTIIMGQAVNIETPPQNPAEQDTSAAAVHAQADSK